MQWLLSIHYLIWILISSVFFALGEFLSKKFALNPSLPYVFLVVMTYAVGTLTWLPAILQKNQLSIVGTIWSVISLMSTVLIGAVIFGEKINATGIAGIFVAIIAIILLSI